MEVRKYRASLEDVSKGYPSSKIPEEFINHLQNSIEQKEKVIQNVDV